jgi:glutathione synthase/RimK-type ligase-like ATP-grasp enzyme
MSISQRDENDPEPGAPTPSLLAVRNAVRGIALIGRLPDYHHILFGFAHAGIPIVNNIWAVLTELNRPMMYGGLLAIQRRIGPDVFPLIPQTHYPSFQTTTTSPGLPFVLKIGWPHAGNGKIRVREDGDFEDIRSVVVVSNTYAIADPFIEADCELRIVFIAPDFYRVQERRSMGWKINIGFGNFREDIEMTSMYKLWCAEVRGAFGELDTFALDVSVTKDGRHYILEVNGSDQRFAPEHRDDHYEHSRELVRNKLGEALSRP